MPGGIYHKWHENGQLACESLPNGVTHEWYENGQMESEKLPDKTERSWNEDKQVAFEMLPNGTTQRWKYHRSGVFLSHTTNGVEDTNVYLAKQRIKEKKEAKLQKLEDKPKLQKAVSKIADTKAFNDIALRVATRKIKEILYLNIKSVFFKSFLEDL